MRVLMFIYRFIIFILKLPLLALDYIFIDVPIEIYAFFWRKRIKPNDKAYFRGSFFRHNVKVTEVVDENYARYIQKEGNIPKKILINKLYPRKDK